MDGRAVNNRYWVFAGGLTKVNVVIPVTNNRTVGLRSFEPALLAFLEGNTIFPPCRCHQASDLARTRSLRRLARAVWVRVYRARDMPQQRTRSAALAAEL